MKPDTVTASEIADFVYCGESWRLAQNGHHTANRAVQDTGTAHHAEIAVAERVAGGFITLGHVLIVLALFSLLAVYLWR